MSATITPFVLGIAGGSASGKTTLARSICELLPPGCADILDLDGYYYSNDHLSFEDRCRINYDEPEAFEFPLIVEHLATLKAGSAVESPARDFAQHLRSATTHTLQPSPVIVVEGILTLYHEPLRALFDHSLYVDTPSDLRFERRMRRDVRDRGRSEDSVRWQWESSVEPSFVRYCLPTREHADMVIDGSTLDPRHVIQLLRDKNFPA